MAEFHAIVSGHVQGVLFRQYVLNHAQSLGLKGFVKNLSNDCVEVVAQGSKEMLEKLVKCLSQGPEFASVENVELEWKEEGEKFSGFSVRY